MLIALISQLSEYDLQFLNTLKVIFLIILFGCMLSLPVVLWNLYQSCKRYNQVKADNERIDVEYWKNKRG